jgi:hypothetical protein
VVALPTRSAAGGGGARACGPRARAGSNSYGGEWRGDESSFIVTEHRLGAALTAAPLATSTATTSTTAACVPAASSVALRSGHGGAGGGARGRATETLGGLGWSLRGGVVRLAMALGE